MPLRDHFRPPVSKKSSWEGFHGGWPMTIVQQLRKQLPEGYVAEPRVHLGALGEVDVSAYRNDTAPLVDPDDAGGGTATAVWTRPTVDVETDLLDQYEYEVRVYDVTRERELVAAVELVSPANKDRPEHRSVFAAKCAGLLQKGVAVSVVDLVGVMHFNLYADLLALLGRADPTLGDPPAAMYAVTCRRGRRGKRTALKAWSHALAVGRPLPTLPLWLSDERVIPLDLEASYEQACHDLWIT